MVQYMSSKGANRKVTFAQRVTRVESSAIINLREKILGSKTELLEDEEKIIICYRKMSNKKKQMLSFYMEMLEQYKEKV